MKKFFSDDHADTKMIGTVVGLLVMIFVSILVFYNIMGSIDAHTLDTTVLGGESSPAENASNNTMAQAATFYTIAPIIAIVIVAVVILRYVGMI